MSDLIVFILLFLASAFFSGSESALFSVSPIYLFRYSYPVVRILKNNPQRLITVITLGNTFVNILITALFTSKVVERFGLVAVGWAVPLVTVLILVFGEIVPKTISVRVPELVAGFSLPIYQFLYYLFYPVVLFVENFIYAVLYPFGFEFKSNVDLMSLVKAVPDPFIPQDMRRSFEIVLRMNSLSSSIMRPRKELVAFSLDSPVKEVVKKAVRSGERYFAVFKGSLDNIVGTLSVIDILKASIKNRPLAKIKMKKPGFFPEGVPLKQILPELYKNGIVFFVDEYGGLMGFVTIEDVWKRVVE